VSGTTIQLKVCRAGIGALLVATACAILPLQGRAARPPLSLQSVLTSQHPTAHGYTIRENLFRGSTRVGAGSGACRSAGATATSATCRVTLRLSTGAIVVAFTISFATDSGRLTVDGGTGTYAGARGKGSLAKGKIRIVFA
jgi:hypothetical protein